MRCALTRVLHTVASFGNRTEYSSLSKSPPRPWHGPCYTILAGRPGVDPKTRAFTCLQGARQVLAVSRDFQRPRCWLELGGAFLKTTASVVKARA